MNIINNYEIVSSQNKTHQINKTHSFFIIMVTKHKSPKYFNFETWNSMRYDRNKFRSQMHRNDPKPFSPRWLSGYALMNPKFSHKLFQTISNYI